MYTINLMDSSYKQEWRMAVIHSGGVATVMANSAEKLISYH
jgi:hypothetical protein